MKRKAFFAAMIVALFFSACQNAMDTVLVDEPQQTPSTSIAPDPIGGLTVRVRTNAVTASFRAITGVSKMVVNLESAEYPSITAIATESGGTFTAQIASVKPGSWKISASLFDATDTEKYFGRTETVIRSGVANAVTLSVSATGSVGVDVTEDTSGPRVSSPVISPGTSNMMETFYVTISSLTENAIIRYSVDGTDPTPTTGILYKGPIFVSQNVTIKAVACKDGLSASSVATQSYTLTLPTYTIGQTGPAGGIIFFDAGNYASGWRYLEAATSDQSNESEWDVAIDMCERITINGYNDWFLPSLSQLKKMYVNRTAIGNFGNYYYWSSTISTSSCTGAAWQSYAYVSFYDGSVDFYHQSMTNSVRAIRSF